MNRQKWLSTLGVIGLAGFWASGANAQATRTWVSGVGDDVNPCSRTAPCKTFAGAISKTAAGGEINCLDPGGFGGVTITKALSIVCDYTEGGILSAGAGVNGIVINAGAADVVFLSGLDLNGAGNAQNGVRMIAGAQLIIRDSIIRNYRASNGRGISFQPSGASRLTVINTIVADNGTGATGGGILIQPTGAAGNARVTLQNVQLAGNSNENLRVDSAGNTNGSANVVDIQNSTITGSVNGVLVSAAVGLAPASVNVDNSLVDNNTGVGLVVSGANSSMRVGGSTITLNGTGTSILGGGTLQSYGDNRTQGNANPATFTPPTLVPN